MDSKTRGNAMLLLDTNVLIRLSEVRLPTDDIALSAIVYAELRLGIERAPDPATRRVRQEELALVSRLFDSACLPFDRAAADGYAQLAARVIQTRPAHARSKDIMLAGHAYAIGAKLMTFNAKDFELVADQVEIVVPTLR